MTTKGHHKEWPPSDPKIVKDELFSSTIKGSSTLKLFSKILGLLSILGLVGLIGKFLIDGGDQTQWGYVAATLAFIFSVTGGAPLVAIAPFIAKANWARPISRMAHVIGASAIVVNIIIMIPLLWVLPPLVVEGARRRSIWFEAPVYSPHFWDTLSLIMLAIAGLGLLYVSALPDFAIMRDNSQGFRKKIGNFLAGGFVGSTVQWSTLRMRVGLMSTLYFFIYIFVHVVISIDFSLSMVPGWRDAIYPMAHAMGGIQGGVALVIILAWIMRKYGKYENYLNINVFWALGRLMFATSLMWIYFFYSAFIVFWYGKSMSDNAWLDLLIRGPMVYVFILGMLFSFIFPWWWLIWNKVRNSINGPVIGAFIALTGVFFERIRVYVPAWSVDPKLIHDKWLTVIPETLYPDIWDILLILGSISFVVLTVIFISRIIPFIGVWEVQQFNLLAKPIKYIKAHGIRVAKPD